MVTPITATRFDRRVTSWEAPLLTNASKDPALQLGIAFHSLDGKDLCHVAIQPSPRPVFIRKASSSTCAFAPATRRGC